MEKHIPREQWGECCWMQRLQHRNAQLDAQIQGLVIQESLSFLSAETF